MPTPQGGQQLNYAGNYMQDMVNQMAGSRPTVDAIEEVMQHPLSEKSRGTYADYVNSAMMLSGVANPVTRTSREVPVPESFQPKGLNIRMDILCESRTNQ